MKPSPPGAYFHVMFRRNLYCLHHSLNQENFKHLIDPYKGLCYTKSTEMIYHT